MTESRVWKLTPGASVLAPGTWASFDGAPPAPPPAPPPDPEPDPEPDPDPDPVPDYVVTGNADSETGSPNGDYFDTGDTHNGEPVYERDDGIFVMWRGNNWALSPGIDNVTPTLWLRDGALSRDGDYPAFGAGGRTNTGTATVTAGT